MISKNPEKRSEASEYLDKYRGDYLQICQYRAGEHSTDHLLYFLTVCSFQWRLHLRCRLTHTDMPM